MLIRRSRRTNPDAAAQTTRTTPVQAKQVDVFASRNRSTHPNIGGVKNPVNTRRQGVAPKTNDGIASVFVGAENADECGSRNWLKFQNYDSVVNPVKYPNNGRSKNPVVIGTQGAKRATTVAAKTNGVTSVVVGARRGDGFGRGNGSKYQYCNSVMNPVSWAASIELSPNQLWVNGYPYYRPTRP